MDKQVLLFGECRCLENTHCGGGYEFLRTDGRSTSGSKVEGYSVQYPKDNLNQATAYIRPLQNDLSLAPLEGHEVEMMVEN